MAATTALPKETTQATQKVKYFDASDANLVVDESLNGRYKPYKKADVADLIPSIIAHGVMQPARAMDMGKGKAKLYLGFRRWKAVQIINDEKLSPIPVKLPVIVEPTDEKEAFFRNLDENKKRRDTTVVDDAHNVERLTKYGVSEDDILLRLSRDGKKLSRAWLVQTRKILRLNEEQKRHIHENNLAASLAYFIADLPEETRTETMQVATELAQQDAAQEMDMPLDEAKQLIDEATNKQAANITPEKLVEQVQKAAEKKGLSKAKARKVATAAKKLVKAKPELKHVHKAATKTGAKEDKRVRKLHEVRDLVVRISEPGNRDYPAPMRKHFQVFSEWMEGGRSTEDAIKLLMKPFVA